MPYYSEKDRCNAVEKYLKSGLPLGEFCKKYSLNRNTLSAWLTAAKKSAANHFVPVVIAEDSKPKQEKSLPNEKVLNESIVEIAIPSGITIRCNAEVSSDWLIEILRGIS